MKRDFHDYWRLNGPPMGNGKSVKAAYNASLFNAKRNDKECNFCGKSGHLEEQCWKKKNQDRHNTHKESEKPSRKKGEATETTKCFHCNKMGYFAYACPKKKKNQGPVSAKAVSFLTEAMVKSDCGTYKSSGFEIEPVKVNTRVVNKQPTMSYWWADACESDEESVMSDHTTVEDDLEIEDICDGSIELQSLELCDKVKQDDDINGSDKPLKQAMDRRKNLVTRDQWSCNLSEKIMGEEEDKEVQVLIAFTHQTQVQKPIQEEAWILDSGASGHFTNNDHMMINKQRTSVPTNVANGPGKNTEIIGDIPLRSIENNMDFRLTAVHLQESFGRNLMSLPVLLEHGCSIVKICTKEIVIDGPKSKNDNNKPIQLIFRRGEDKLYYLHVKRMQGCAPKALIATVIPDDSEDEENPKERCKRTNLDVRETVEKTRKLRSIDIMVAHELLGHPGEKKVRDTAKIQGWKLVGAWQACEWCDQAKARQKNISKVTERRTTHPGEMLHLDLTGPFKTTPSNSRFAMVIVDDFTDRKWIHLLQRKSQALNELEELLNWLKGRNITCKYIRMDGGGENQPIKKLCDINGIVPEYTARETPQQNGKVERAIATLKDWATADILRLKCDEKWWGANMIHKAVCDNMMPRKGFNNAYEPFNERPPVKDKDMVPFGAQGIMATRRKMKRNWTAKGEEVFMVGYTEDAPSDCYNVVKKSTGRVVASRDIKWSNPYWKTSQDTARSEERLTMQTAISENLVDPVLPEVSDSEDSDHNDDEQSTGILNNHGVVDSSADYSSEEESMNPSLQSGEYLHSC